jgi:hypothetical protein
LRRVEEFLVSIKNFISFHKFSLQENNSCQKTKEQLTPNPKNNEKKNKEIPKSVPILGPKSKKKIFLTYPTYACTWLPLLPLLVFYLIWKQFLPDNAFFSRSE